MLIGADMDVHFRSLALLAWGLISSFLHKTAAEICSGECEYHFDIRYARSMTYRIPGQAAYHVIQDAQGFRLLGNSWHVKPFDNLVDTYVNASDVLSVDGFSRNIIIINDQFPGPNIEVMEGTQVGN